MLLWSALVVSPLATHLGDRLLRRSFHAAGQLAAFLVRAGSSPSGYRSMSPVSAPFWHAAGTGRTSVPRGVDSRRRWLSWRYAPNSPGGVAGVLLLAVGTRAADALGIGGPRLRCGCVETCWCKRPGLTVFRWVTPGRWHHIGLTAEEKQSRHSQA